MKNKVKIRIFVCCAFFALFFGFKLPNVAADVNMEAPIMDGEIGIAEWMNADVYETFFIDAENTDGNIDASNSLYIGEDDDNIYIGIDLNSDQSTDPAGEWVGFWLNTNNRTFSTPEEWGSFLNNGTESFIYDVEKDSIWDPWKNDGTTKEIGKILQKDSEVQTIEGTSTGTYNSFNSYDSDIYNVTSNASNYTRLDFTINISDWYSYQKEIQINATQKFRVTVGLGMNESISSHNILIWYPNGTLT